MSRGPAVVHTTQAISAISQMSASSFSRLWIRGTSKGRQTTDTQFHHHPLSQTKSSNLNQLEVPLSLVTEAHSEALPWKLQTSSVLFIREELAQKYFMISVELNIYSSQHNEVKLVIPVLCEDSSGVFFNQAVWTSHHLQWAVICCKLAGKSRAALREAKWCLKNKTIQPKGWKRKGVTTALQPFPKADYILALFLPRGYKWCCYWLLCKVGFLPGTEISHLTHATAYFGD